MRPTLDQVYVLILAGENIWFQMRTCIKQQAGYVESSFSKKISIFHLRDIAIEKEVIQSLVLDHLQNKVPKTGRLFQQTHHTQSFKFNDDLQVYFFLYIIILQKTLLFVTRGSCLLLFLLVLTSSTSGNRLSKSEEVMPKKVSCLLSY